MTGMQYERAKGRLLQRMVRIVDRKCPSTSRTTGDADVLDSEDDDVEFGTNENYSAADKEWKHFETYKIKRHRPFVEVKKARTLGEGNRKILVGPVETKGEDLPSGKNIADYVDKRGRMDLLRFFEDHRNMFPTLWIISQCEMSNQVVEVGCERFFNISGYVSSEKRTRLKVRTYERLAILAAMIQKVYIDYEWIAKEYLRRTRNKLWDTETTNESLKCFNLERNIEADLNGVKRPPELTIDDLLEE